MSEHDRERLDRLELKLTDLMIKVDQNEAMLQELKGHVAQQNQLISRILNLLGLTLTELVAENTPQKPHALLLLMRRALN